MGLHAKSFVSFSKLAVAASLVAAIGCAGGIQAQKQRVAVLDLKGPSAEQVTGEVAAAISGEYEVVSGNEYRRAARELGVERDRPADVSKVARSLGISAVLTGKVVRRARARVAVKLRLRRADSGKVTDRHTVVLARRKSYSDEERDRLAIAALAMLDGLPVASDWRDDWRAGHRHGKPAVKKRKRVSLRKRIRARRKMVAARRKQQREQEMVAKREGARRDEKRGKAARGDVEVVVEDLEVVENSQPAPSRVARRGHQRPKAVDELAAIDAMPAARPTYDDRGQAIDDEVPDALK